MTDNTKYKINSYIQILKYVDDGNERSVIVERVCELLDMVPDVGYKGSANNYSNLDAYICDKYLEDYKDSNIRKIICLIAEMNINKYLSSSDIVRLANKQKIEIKEDIVRLGWFINKYHDYFITNDDVEVCIKKRGTGSNLYQITKRSEE